MSQSTVRASGAHGLVALIPRERNGCCLRFPIGFLLADHPIGRFGEMAGDGPDGLRVALAPSHALVEATDVAMGQPPPAREADGVRGFGEGLSRLETSSALV